MPSGVRGPGLVTAITATLDRGGPTSHCLDWEFLTAPVIHALGQLHSVEIPRARSTRVAAGGLRALAAETVVTPAAPSRPLRGAAAPAECKVLVPCSAAGERFLACIPSAGRLVLMDRTHR